MTTTEPYRAFGMTFGGELADEVRRVAKRWWLITLLGVFTAGLGIILLLSLTTAVGVLALFVSIGLIIEGVDEIIMADRHTTRWPFYVLGAVWIVVGIIALTWPGITLLALAVLIGIGFVVGGILQIAASLTWRRGLPMWGLWLTLGILTVIAGTIALVWPGVTILTLAILLGIALLMRGLGEIWFSLQLRKAKATASG
ncbi:hypothetical protein BAY61_00145 [Prauserella marina]|uniref:Uncharacterized membrane protein HdeD, DUF308 family n=1 Tax=Prauserella marina TaxID=530584 RepID=A0A222VIA9_9PSEU|nr:DUF308 domain-containing protein [Prauserella marina]ASR33659.1 hypothetical protein BAY61_00145 [Prauserella marina]PWV82204.1 uncharacterized membrane protein HdeD (DUF308 family) [Prauserella marina]SDD21543.1 Uncharacterized membrane protein HdeD, DUF308 family [Prauserella marina]